MFHSRKLHNTSASQPVNLQFSVHPTDYCILIARNFCGYFNFIDFVSKISFTKINSSMESFATPILHKPYLISMTKSNYVCIDCLAPVMAFHRYLPPASNLPDPLGRIFVDSQVITAVNQNVRNTPAALPRQKLTQRIYA